MIKTILFIIVIAIIAYFIYRSFNESKLKGGVDELSDEQIWGIVDHVIKNGDYGDSDYVPANYAKFPDNYRPYLMFEYAKGINAYHKKYEDIIKFDNVEDVSGYYNCDAYKYTNNNVELTILASKNDKGDIESCYKLIVKCDDFTDTDSSPLYRQLPNDIYRQLSTQNVMNNDYEAEMHPVRENLNNSNSNFGDRVRSFNKDLTDIYSTDSNNDNSATQQSTIEPVTVINKNMNLINNDDGKEDNQLVENNNKTIYEGESNIAQREEQEDETDIGNQEAETTYLNNQTTEQTEFGNQSNEVDKNDDAEKELIELFNKTVSIMEKHEYREYKPSTVVSNYILNGENVEKLQQALKNENFVRETFKKINANDKYEIEYSEKDGWKIVRKEE